jgi:hypothetical protein
VIPRENSAFDGNPSPTWLRVPPEAAYADVMSLLTNKGIAWPSMPNSSFLVVQNVFTGFIP